MGNGGCRQVLASAYDGRQGESSRWPHTDPRPGKGWEGGQVKAGPSGARASPRYAVRVFRRRSADPPEVVDQEPQSPGEPETAAGRAGVTLGKGKPTPKRS